MSSSLVRLAVSILLLTAAAGGAAGQAKYAVRPVENPEFRPSQIFFRFEDIASPPFDELRRRFPFAETVKGVEDEFERILRLRHWIFTTLKVDNSKPNPPMDAISILAQGPSGGPFECSHAMLAQNAVMNAMGYVTRCLQPGPGGEENTYIAAGNHGVNEVWSNTHRKWFISDAEFDGHFEKGGVPLSALEIRDELLKNDAKDVDLVVGPERKKAKPELLFSPHAYRFVAYELTGDRHTQSGWSSGAMAVWEDEYFRTHTWYRWAFPLGGKAPPHWALRQNFFVRVAHRDWIEWTPNVVSVGAEIQGEAARVRLRSHTPNLARHEMRRPGGRWEPVGTDFNLPLQGPRVEREFRAANVAGVAGPVSRLRIERE
ncbi:MAG: hypothetical protein KIT09_13635 [Bryobacteraceae bacterium]|nr:hypothetical protein [Bryobacteraceae bacterium]